MKTTKPMSEASVAASQTTKDSSGLSAAEISAIVAGASASTLLANRWYDQLFRFCLYAYWVLAAWHVALISQYVASPARSDAGWR